MLPLLGSYPFTGKISYIAPAMQVFIGIICIWLKHNDLNVDIKLKFNYSICNLCKKSVIFVGDVYSQFSTNWIMTEEFLQYLWKYRLYRPGLTLVGGEPFELIHPGEQNFDSGPDFFNTRIRIGETIWAGNSEIHIKSSDWNRHNHQFDKNYSNVILHIVHENDSPVIREDGQPIPAIELKGKYDLGMFERYRGFMQNKQWVPCSGLIERVSGFEKEAWLECLLIERLARKESYILEELKQTQYDWHETFYRALARAFGFKLNADVFESLVKTIPLKYLAKHKDNLIQLEALLFGQAGLIREELIGQYPQTLWHEYNFLRKKFRLQPIKGHLWKFMRLRPSNFPTIRIAQFAMLINKSSGLLSKLLEARNYKELQQLLDVGCSGYWLQHYQFDKTSPSREKRLGRDSVNLLVINTVVPFMFALGRQKDDQAIKDKALQLLQELRGELNSVTKKWASLGMDVRSAAQSQALIELKNNYCDLKKCLTCRIGNTLIRNANCL
jgi:hypothetical protein